MTKAREVFSMFISFGKLSRMKQYNTTVLEQCTSSKLTYGVHPPAGGTHPANGMSRPTGRYAAKTRCLPDHQSCFKIPKLTPDRGQYEIFMLWPRNGRQEYPGRRTGEARQSATGRVSVGTASGCRLMISSVEK